MTYQSSWGFSNSNDNEFSVKEAISASNYLNIIAESADGDTCGRNSFLFQFQLSRESAESLPTGTDICQKFRFSGDFEQISGQQICRMMFRKTSGIAYASHCEPSLTLLGSDSSALLAISKTFNLELTAAVDCDSSQDEFRTDHNGDGDHVKHFIVFSLLDCLLRGEYSAFAVYDQSNGVVARRLTENLLQVFALKTYTINSQGEGCLTVEAYCYKGIPLTVPAALSEPLVVTDQPRKGSVEGEEGDEIDSRVSPVAVFVPTSEQVRLLKLIPYHTPTSKTLAAAPNSVFLAPLDVLNRRRGYSLFLPDSYEAFRLYWDLGYGITLPAVSAQSVRIVLAHIATELGDRIVPVDALLRSATELSARTKLHAAKMAANLHADLQAMPFFSSVSAPVLSSEFSAADAHPFTPARTLLQSSTAATVPATERVTFKGMETVAAGKFAFTTALSARKSSSVSTFSSSDATAHPPAAKRPCVSQHIVFVPAATTKTTLPTAASVDCKIAKPVTVNAPLTGGTAKLSCVTATKITASAPSKSKSKPSVSTAASTNSVPPNKLTNTTLVVATAPAAAQSTVSTVTVAHPVAQKTCEKQAPPQLVHSDDADSLCLDSSQESGGSDFFFEDAPPQPSVSKVNKGVTKSSSATAAVGGTKAVAAAVVQPVKATRTVLKTAGRK